MSCPVQLAGHRLLAYGATGMFGQANATTAPTGQVGVLVSTGPAVLLNASSYTGIRLVFAAVSASSIGAPFRITLRDSFGHVIEKSISMSSSGPQNMDFAFGSFSAPPFASTFGPSSPGVFSMSQVSGISLDYMPTAVGNFDVQLGRIQTYGGTATPEGSSAALLMAGIFGIGFGIRRRIKQ